MTTTRIRDEALARGSLGQAALDMMRSVVAAQLSRFPGFGAADSVDDLVNDFFEGKGAGYANVIAILPDDRAARNETNKWVKRWLVDRARERPWGALRNRLEKRLERSDLFTASAARHHWYLSGGEDVDRPVTDALLRDIAATAPVDIVLPVGEGAVRLGRAGQLEEMLRRLLDAAGRLHVTAITRICSDRFPSLLQTGDLFSSTVDADWDVVEDTTTARDSEAATVMKRAEELIAEQLLPQLTDRECAAIRAGDDPAELATELGIGRSSAYSIMKNLRARLTELAGDAEGSRDVLAALIRLVLDDTAAVPSKESMDMEDSHVV